MEERRNNSEILDRLDRIHDLQLSQVRDIATHAEAIATLKKAGDRAWWMHMLGPFMVVLHAGARKFGVNL